MGGEVAKVLHFQERRRPLAARPGMLPRTMKFNQVVGVDLLEAKVGEVFPGGGRYALRRRDSTEKRKSNVVSGKV